MEFLLLLILGTIAFVIAMFWLGIIIAGLPAALLATGLWYIGTPVWLAAIAGLIAWAVLISWLEDRKDAQKRN